MNARIIVLTTLMLMVAISTASANDWRDANTCVERSGYDDALHFAIGSATSFLVYKVVDDKESSIAKIVYKFIGESPLAKRAIAIAVPIVIGTAKELTDKNFDIGDIAGYAAGGIVTVSILEIKF